MSNIGNQVPGNRAAAGTYRPPNSPTDTHFSARASGRANDVPGGGTRGTNFEAMRPRTDQSMMAGNNAAPTAKPPPPPALTKPYGFNVEKFKSQALNKYGVMRNNLFLVTLYFPNRVGTSRHKFVASQQDVNLVPMFCSACMLPSRTLGTQDIVSRYGYDIPEKMPGYQEFSDIPLTFISDGHGEVIHFFHRWMRFIVNVESNEGMYKPDSNSKALPYEVSYKDDYSAIMEIIVYNESMGRIMVYEFYEVFPKSIYNTQLNWRFTGEIATLDTLMTYRYFKESIFDMSGEGVSESRGLSTFQKIVKAATLAQTVAAVVKKPQSIVDVANMAGTAGMVARNFNFTR